MLAIRGHLEAGVPNADQTLIVTPGQLVLPDVLKFKNVDSH